MGIRTLPERPLSSTTPDLQISSLLMSLTMFLIKSVNHRVSPSGSVHKDINMHPAVTYNHSICSTICAQERTECITSCLAVRSEGASPARRCDDHVTAWTQAAGEASPPNPRYAIPQPEMKDCSARLAGGRRRRGDSPRIIRLCSGERGGTGAAPTAARLQTDGSWTERASRV